jgi:hypothetical protein
MSKKESLLVGWMDEPWLGWLEEGESKKSDESDSLIVDEQ